jgi:hypothetical protein
MAKPSQGWSNSRNVLPDPNDETVSETAIIGRPVHRHFQPTGILDLGRHGDEVLQSAFADLKFARNVANRVGPTLRDVKQVGNERHIVEDGPNGGQRANRSQ